MTHRPPGSPPPPTRGHLPIGSAADFDWGIKPSTAPTPRLGEVVRDAERLAAQLVTVLARQYDPASAPVGALGEPDVALSDVHLGRAVALVHAAVAELSAVTFLSLPPVGSAVPAHTDVSRDRSGGPGTDSRLRVSTSPYLVYTAGAYSAEGATS